jgi:glycosyltransferase involved in cell wall biosynthesis
MNLPANPKLSIIVIAYRMQRQAMNTLYSLSAHYQKNISVDDYEVIVVENRSDENLDEHSIRQLLPNSRYFLRDESGVSPVHAINFAFAQCRAQMIALMIDGARLLTPRVLEYALMAQRIDTNALIAVPGYNLGPAEHQHATHHAYTQQQEIASLERIKWKDNGYRLFEISSLGGANPTGVINPLLESNCVFASRTCFEKIGYADTEFTYPGGGSLNLHLFRSLGMLPETNRYFILAGEGSFHQLHGGVTTQAREDREQMLKQFARQVNKRWGVFSVLKREPILLGAVPSHAQRFLKYSCDEAVVRFKRLDENHTPHWVDDLTRCGEAG